MNDYERLEERCNHAEAKCQELEEKLADALLKLEKISDVLDISPDSSSSSSWWQGYKTGQKDLA